MTIVYNLLVSQGGGGVRVQGGHLQLSPDGGVQHRDVVRAVRDEHPVLGKLLEAMVNGHVHVINPFTKGSDGVQINLGELERDAVELLSPLSPELRVLGILGGARVHLDRPWVIIQRSERADSVYVKETRYQR